MTEEVTADTLLRAYAELNRLLKILGQLSHAQSNPALSPERISEILARKDHLLEAITARQPGALSRQASDCIRKLERAGSISLARDLRAAMDDNHRQMTALAASERDAMASFRMRLCQLQASLGDIRQGAVARQAYCTSGRSRSVAPRFLDGRL